MTAINRVLTCILCLLIFTPTARNMQRPTISRSRAFVNFNPFVSILDNENQYRYTVDDLVPLVSIVATRFSRIFVQVSTKDLEHGRNTSLSLSPLAVAKYNTRAKRPLEVWLAFEGFDERTFHINGQDPSLLPSRLEQIADVANSIHRDTVTTLFIPYNHLHLHRIKLEKNFTSLISELYRFGITVQSKLCESKLYIERLKLFTPSVILVSLPDIVQSTSRQELERFVSENLDICREHVNQENEIRLGIIASIPDTNDHDRVNMTRLVNTWKRLEKMYEFQDAPRLVLSQAFDTPYRDKVQQKSNGWWRLQETSHCFNVSCYKFEEKRNLASVFDSEESRVDFAWLEKPLPVSKDYTGMVYSLYSESKRSEFTIEEMQPILNIISNNFSKAVLLVDDTRDGRLPSIINEGKTLATIRKNIDVVVWLTGNTNIFRHIPTSIDFIATRFGIPPDVFSTYIGSYIKNQTVQLKEYVLKKVLHEKKRSSYKFGFALPVSVCGAYDLMNEAERMDVDQATLDGEMDIIYFSFEEDEETVKLGARRMFQQRVVLLEQCRAFWQNQMKKRENSTQLGFLMLHYEVIGEAEFYKDPWRIQNFARYWELLITWAQQTKTIMILNNAIDAPRTIRKKDKNTVETEVGWWRYTPSSTDRIWIDKKQDALQKFKKAQNKGIGVAELIAAIVVPVLIATIVILFGLAFFLIRRHQQVYLTKAEIDDFFVGNEEGIGEQDGNYAQKLPYDKAHYEIGTKDFSIETGENLGAGEFGTVSRGTVQTSDGKINVAIKMLNTDRAHKTALSGLLSEIKVLAYVGKHSNVIELLGANTEHLKQGKVYVFLELCQLGSLEKYLRKFRPSTDRESVAEAEADSSFVLDSSRYVNTTGSSKQTGPILDEALANDMYRWSYEICNGMSYLATKHVVHADLATRNVLLNLKGQAKICDFGLSRRMYNYANYVKQKQEPLPWKWMPPEALRFLEFSEKSDVWAFGVTLWEIYSLGENPFPGLSYDLNFANLLERGLRMSQPRFHERNMYSIMMDCWKTHPDKRPTFADLLTRFDIKPKASNTYVNI